MGCQKWGGCWASPFVQRSNDTADFEAYLQKYPNGSYKALAENRLKRLKADQQVPAAPSSTAPPTASATGSSTAFDGRWAITLICEDVGEGGKVAKGYTFNFFSDVKEGRLTGQKGEPGRPGSLTLIGVIKADGSAEINSNGLTANPDYALGTPARARRTRTACAAPSRRRAARQRGSSCGPAKRRSSRTDLLPSLYRRPLIGPRNGL